MKILAIETSCDDTCVAILEVQNSKTELPTEAKAKRTSFSSPFKILSNVVSSQVKLHKKYGGIYPSLAKREHQKNLPIVLNKAIKEAKKPKVDLMAVTVGPGLEPCLWVGINFGIELAKKLKVPIVPVNHIEAHILINFLKPPSYIQNTKYLFPAVCLVVSGGHTQLILMSKTSKSRKRPGDHFKYKILGETRDDAAGECFDKVARILNLGYPGGPAIAAEASKSNIRNTKHHIRLPRPMIYQKNYDFSFSGLKTAALYDFKSRSPKVRKSKEYIRAMAVEVQQAVIDVLIKKTIKAAKNYKVKTIILGGGVAANEELRGQFREKIRKELPNIKYIIPETKQCTDNAVMIAIAAYFHRSKRKNKDWKKIKANANLKI